MVPSRPGTSANWSACALFVGVREWCYVALAVGRARVIVARCTGGGVALWSRSVGCGGSALGSASASAQLESRVGSGS